MTNIIASFGSTPALLADPAIPNLIALSPASFDALSIGLLTETLYSAHYVRIHQYFKFRLHRKSDADDLAQTVFLKMSSSIQKGLWDGKGGIPYIFTIARNTLIDHFRRNKHTPIVSDLVVESATEMIVAPSHNREQYDILQSAMIHLSAIEAQAVNLRYFEDKEYAQIAKIMDRKEASARQLVHRGLKALRIILEPQVETLQF